MKVIAVNKSAVRDLPSDKLTFYVFVFTQSMQIEIVYIKVRIYRFFQAQP